MMTRISQCREIERTGGLTGGVRDDILFVLGSLIKLAGEIDSDLGEVFSQILVRQLTYHAIILRGL